MPRVFHAAHIVCLPSYREGLPKVLLEAAACGRPLVTTDAPGCREVVLDGENGFLVPIQDATGLAAALCKLIHDGPLRSHMGRRAREVVLKEFSNEHIFRQALTIYRELT
jgi:glycosyltransferase involved in cell wall biosynthesis